MSFATCTIGVWSRPKRGEPPASHRWHDPRVENTIMRFSSILFFSIGFVVALHIREYRKTAFGGSRCWDFCLWWHSWFPLVSVIPPVEVFYCFLGQDDDVDLTGSLIETHPAVTFMTSGNYRKMLTAAPNHWGKGDLDEYRRQAMNYGIVVELYCGSFISVAILMHFIHQWAIWLITRTSWSWPTTPPES